IANAALSQLSYFPDREPNYNAFARVTSPAGHWETRMAKDPIATPLAPAAPGTYSQGIKAGKTIYLSGQLGLDPATGNLHSAIDTQIDQAFKNLRAVATEAGASLDDAVKLTLFLT